MKNRYKVGDKVRMTKECLDFQVTKIGCGLAGYTEVEIAPMFKGAPTNCFLPDGWRS